MRNLRRLARPTHRNRAVTPTLSHRVNNRDRYDWITLATTIVGVIVVAVSTCFTAWQAYLTKKQLDSFISEQRAWLSIDAIPANGLEISPAGVSGEIIGHLKNIASEPARNVDINVVSYAYNDKNLSACDSEDRNRGGSIFPAEEYNDRYKFFISATDWGRATMNSGDAAIIISICARYTSGATGKRQHTERSFMMSQNNKLATHKFEAEPHIVNRENLYLSKLAVNDISD